LIPSIIWFQFTALSHAAFKICFNIMLLRMIFGPKRNEVRREGRRRRNEQLHALYSSPNTTRVIKSRRLGGAGHGESMGGRG
jgi:hypothetical protein